MGKRQDIFHLGFWSTRAIVFGRFLDAGNPDLEGAIEESHRLAGRLGLPEPPVPDPSAANFLRESSGSWVEEEQNLLEVGLHASLILYDKLPHAVKLDPGSPERSERIRPILRFLDEIRAHARDAGATDAILGACEQTRAAARDARVVEIINELEDVWFSAATLLDDIEHETSGPSDIERTLLALEETVRGSGIFDLVREDIQHDLAELRACIASDLPRATLAMCGRVVENSLRLTFFRETGAELPEDATVGRMIARIREERLYVDPGLKNAWNIINAQRIVGVHAKEGHPIPSRVMVLCVAYATVESVERCL